MDSQVTELELHRPMEEEWGKLDGWVNEVVEVGDATIKTYYINITLTYNKFKSDVALTIAC